ncbi:MAG: hypothetical protein GQ552_01165 [Flavobacteriaceae bacterium]|nr:hypothetical protein [Flavobacteriaceae bacterium]
MKKQLLTQIIFFAIIIMTIKPAYCQANSNEKNNYKWFDNSVGIENTGLFNGLRYKEEYRTLDGSHKFYLSPNYINGNIVYDGQAYYDIKMKYDLFEDEIIVNLTANSGSSILQLLIDKIDAFSINENNFTKLHDNPIINSSEIITGIYQIIYQSPNLVCYKKNKKNAKKNLTKKNIYYSFKSEDSYYFYLNNDFFLVSSKRDFTKIFPDYKKEINSFYTNNKFLLNSNPDAFMTKLSSKLSDLNTKNSSKN